MPNGKKLQRSVLVVVASALTMTTVFIWGCRSGDQYSSDGGPSVIPASLSSSVVAVDFRPTPERLERGKYLVEGPAHCFQCHSQVDWKTPGSQPFSETKGAGHNWSDFGLPFLTAPNITPDRETGAGNWSDETLARAIREGVGHDGRRLFPLMPYLEYAKMSDEDLASVIGYVRTIRPVRNELPTTSLPDELKSMLPPPRPITAPVSGPDPNDPVSLGRYLVVIGNCAECHTPKNEKGVPLAGLDLAGGFVLEGPWGKVASANLTSDPSGISYYDEDLFVQTIRNGQVKARKLNSIMPWGYFRKMTDDDLKSIFAYLRTLKPVQHRVDNTENPSFCEVCGSVHGFGSRNLIN